MNSKIKMGLSVIAFLIAATVAYLMFGLGLGKVDSTDVVERYVERINDPGRVSWKEYFVLYDIDIFRTVFAAPLFYAIGGLVSSFSRVGFIVFQVSALPLAWYYVLCIFVSPVYAFLALFVSLKTVLGLVYFIEPIFALIVCGIQMTAYQKMHFQS